MSQSTVDLLRQRLDGALQPLALEIADESAQHAGHAGAGSGGHYAVRIVAAAFAGLGTLARHRLVNQAAGDLFPKCIHALRIDARAPGEV